MIIKMNIAISSFFFFLSSCGHYEYSKGESKESNNLFLKKKQFFFGFSFSGKIEEKRKCDYCKYNRYVLLIKLDSSFVAPDFSNLQYPPYYSIKPENFLSVSVPKKVYDSSELGNRIIKNGKSNLVEVQHRSFVFLSNDKNTWLPKK